MVKLELYRVFREVAEAGNISLAAENLYLSQSAVSQSVKQLEQQLGTRLFLRSPRGVTLTEDDRLLFEYVRSAMGLLETGEDKLQQSRTLQAGTLVIGASDTVTSQFLLPHLDTFHRRYPNIHIRIISGRSYKVLGLLRAGRVDIAFASAPGDADDLEHIPCFETHSCFVAAPDYPCDFTRAYTRRLPHSRSFFLKRRPPRALTLKNTFSKAASGSRRRSSSARAAFLSTWRRLASALRASRANSSRASSPRARSASFPPLFPSRRAPSTSACCATFRPAPQPNVLPAMCLKNYRANPFPFKFCKVSVISHIESAHFLSFSPRSFS